MFKWIKRKEKKLFPTDVDMLDLVETALLDMYGDHFFCYIRWTHNRFIKQVFVFDMRDGSAKKYYCDILWRLIITKDLYKFIEYLKSEFE